MLNGKKLGAAIDSAIVLKLETGAAKSKAEIARHFLIKPPSLSDWVKKGSISKDKIPELFRYFSDVVGHKHWGLTADEWPAGLSLSAKKDRQRGNVEALFKNTDRLSGLLKDLVIVAKAMNERGQIELIGRAKEMAPNYPADQKNSAKS